MRIVGYKLEDYPLLLHPHSEPIAFDNYLFQDPHDLSLAFSHAIFVFAGNLEFPGLGFVGDRPLPESRMLPLSSVLYPDGETAYRVFYQKAGWSCSPHRVIVKCCGLAGHDQAASLGSFSVD
jgi:hypothetical protein